MEMLCIMWQNNTDRISGTVDQLARLCRCTPEEVEAATKEIRSADVCETVNGGAVYTLISRRRARELEVSKIKSDAGKQGGRPSDLEKQNESKTKANEKAASASASASASVPEGMQGEPKQPNPSLLALEVHQAFPNPPTIPAARVVGNVAELIESGYTAAQIREAITKSRKLGKWGPQSADSLTDPAKFQKWLSAEQEQDKPKHRMAI
jgi:hypothetical protein